MFGKYLAITTLALLIQLIGIGWGQMQSPCPNVFQYVRYENTGEIEGYIEIPRVPIGVGILIRMSLSVAATLPTNYVGKLELAESKDRAVERIRQGWPLTYRVHFPVQRPVPLVTRIEFNNKEYCSGPRATGPFVTAITLEHILSPPGGGSQLSNPSIEGQTPSFYLGQSPISHSQPSQTQSFYSNQSPNSYLQPGETQSFYSNQSPSHSSQPTQTQSFYSNQNPNPYSQPSQIQSFYSNQSPSHSSQPSQTPLVDSNQNPNPSLQPIQTESFYLIQSPNPPPHSVQKESFYSNQRPSHSSQPSQTQLQSSSHSSQPIQIQSFYSNQSPSHSSQPSQTQSQSSSHSSQPIQTQSFYSNQSPSHSSQPSQTQSQGSSHSSQPIQIQSFYSNQSPSHSSQPSQTQSQSSSHSSQSIQTQSFYSNQSPSHSSQQSQTPSFHSKPRPIPSSQPSSKPSMHSKPRPTPKPSLHSRPRPSSQSIHTPSSSVTNKPYPEQSAVPMRTTEFNWNLVPTLNSTLVQVPNQNSVLVAGPPSKPIANNTPIRDLSEFENCGRPEKNSVNYLISKGDRTQPGDWPWLVAIFVSRIKLEFQCAGNLLTDRHVLTAAHCLKSGATQELPANVLLAVVGRYKLRGWSEKGSVTLEVSKFVIHSEYGQVKTGFDCDIAVMTLAETVTFTKLIRPICLWSGPSNTESIVGKTGFVLGWGRDELGNPVTDEPRIAKVPIVSQEICLRSNPDFVEVTSNRTFCGGSRDGSGPCNGDSGSGLFLYDRQKRRYHVRGLVSLSLLDRETGACDLSQYVVFTDVAKYLPWIKQQIRN